jgi:hypothetical protein
MSPGSPIAIKIDQTLTQDATGTLVMLALEAMGLNRIRTELSAQYVDHNLLQVDSLNADDHLFLDSACRRFGIWYSRPGNGISHVVHMQHFGKPGKSLLGSDSHTPAAGSLGMLASSSARPQLYSHRMPRHAASWNSRGGLRIGANWLRIAIASGASAGYQISQVYGGGLIPILAGLILKSYGIHRAYFYIGLLIMVYAALAILAILGTPETKKVDLEGVLQQP